MIDGADHLARIIDALVPLPPQVVPLPDALGRLLAGDVVATLDLPGFDNSAMDGYAVRAADVDAVTSDSPQTLTVLGDIPAGDGGGQTLTDAGTAYRIMTGAPMPTGADAVVPVEATDGGTERVVVREPAAAGEHLRHRGDDVSVGDVVLRGDGRLLGPGHLALGAAAGVATLTVRSRPRVAVLSTGDELVAVGQRPGPGQIVDSNSLMLTALARAAGAQVVLQSSVADDADALTTALAGAAGAADLVLSTGGVSMGAYDTVKEVLAAAGTVQFDKVAMRPGMPQGFGVLDGATPIITLPGNPVSALVSFHVFVLPALAALAGGSVEAAAWPDALGHGVRVPTAEAWSSAGGRVELARVTLSDGTVSRSGGQGSHMLGALASGTHLAVVPADRDRVEVGDELVCLPLLGSATSGTMAG